MVEMHSCMQTLELELDYTSVRKWFILFRKYNNFRQVSSRIHVYGFFISISVIRKGK